MYCTVEDILPLIDDEKVERLLNIDQGGEDESTETSGEEDAEVSALNAKIQGYIDAAATEMHAWLGGYYVIPITGSQSIVICAGIQIGLVLGMIYLPNLDGNMPQRIQDKVSRGNDLLDQYGKNQVVGKTDVVFTPAQFLPDAKTNQKSATVIGNAALNYQRGL